MQGATLPPWLSAWPGGVVYGARQLKPLDYIRALSRERERQRSRLTIYTYGHDDQQIFRIGGWSGRGSGTARPLAGWERYPLDQFALQPHSSQQDVLQARVNVEWMGPAPTPAPAAFAARPALRAWLLGTALVALIVIVARSIDKCLHLKLGKSRRQSHDSQEWQTPNVRATNRQMVDNGNVIIPGLEDAEPLPADLCDTISIDLPPPYSECTDAGAPGPTGLDHNKVVSDLPSEEPPPYSDCYVEFSNKDGIPSVLIFSRKRTPLINRREIVGSNCSETEIFDDEMTTTDQNTENINMEIANEAVRIGENNGDINYVHNTSNDDATKLKIYSRETDGNPGTSSIIEPIVAINDERNNQDRVAQLLV